MLGICQETVLSPSPIAARPDQFFAIYAKQLQRCLGQFPEKYRFGPERVPDVVSRMRAAVESNQNYVEGPAFHATLKELNIRPTRKALYEYLGTPPQAERTVEPDYETATPTPSG